VNREEKLQLAISARTYPLNLCRKAQQKPLTVPCLSPRMFTVTVHHIIVYRKRKQEHLPED